MKFRILIIGPTPYINEVSLSNFGADEVEWIERQGSTLNRCLVQIAKCNLIVTLKDWETESLAQKIIEIARITETSVVHEINFKNYVQSKND